MDPSISGMYGSSKHAEAPWPSPLTSCSGNVLLTDKVFKRDLFWLNSKVFFTSYLIIVLSSLHPAVSCDMLPSSTPGAELLCCLHISWYARPDKTTQRWTWMSEIILRLRLPQKKHMERNSVAVLMLTSNHFKCTALTHSHPCAQESPAFHYTKGPRNPMTRWQLGFLAKLKSRSYDPSGACRRRFYFLEIHGFFGKCSKCKYPQLRSPSQLLTENWKLTKRNSQSSGSASACSPSSASLSCQSLHPPTAKISGWSQSEVDQVNLCKVDIPMDKDKQTYENIQYENIPSRYL